MISLIGDTCKCRYLYIQTYIKRGIWLSIDALVLQTMHWMSKLEHSTNSNEVLQILIGNYCPITNFSVYAVFIEIFGCIQKERQKKP